MAIQLGCCSTSQTSHQNTPASCSLTCRSLRERQGSLILSYKPYLVMKEPVSLNKLLSHHLGKSDGLHPEVQFNPAVRRKDCSLSFQTCSRTTRLPVIPNSSPSGKTSTPLPAISQFIRFFPSSPLAWAGIQGRARRRTR